VTTRDASPGPVTQRPWWRTRATWGVILAIAAGLALFVTDCLWKRVPTARVMKRFVAAMREGRTADARVLVTSNFASFLDAEAQKPPDAGRSTNQGATLARLRAARDVSTSVFVGEWTRGCIYGQLDGTRFYTVLLYADGAWRIDDVRTDGEPRICRETNDEAGE